MNFFSHLPSELWINEALQSSFLSYFHSFFVFLSYLDTIPYYLTVCAFVRVVFPGQLGFRYIYLLTSAPYLASLLKHSFNLPRPGHFTPGLDLVGTGSWYGFPSGAALGAVLLAMLLATHFEGKKGVLLGGGYFSLMVLSRLYLGAHFLLDVIGGTFFGLLIWMAYRSLEKMKLLEALKSSFQLILGFTIFGILYFLHPSNSSLELVLMLSGFLLFHVMVPEGKASYFTWKCFGFTLFGLYTLFFSTKFLSGTGELLSLFLIGVWLSTGHSFCYETLYARGGFSERTLTRSKF